MKKRVVIIGAGFAGVNLAQSLRKVNVDVVLIDKNNFQTFPPLLYQVATGGLEPSNIAYPVRRQLRNQKNARFMMADVKNIDTQEKKIILDQTELSYDYLVIATGSTNNFFNFEPIKELLMTLKTVGDALDIRSKLMQNLEQLNYEPEESKEKLVHIAIVGAGPAGVEVAGALAEMKKKVLPKDFPDFDFNRMKIFLFEAGDRVLGAMSEVSSTYSLKYLEQLGVSVKLNARVSSFDGNQISLESGEVIKTNTVIWTAGVKGNPVNGLPENAILRGARIEVNEFNQLIKFPEIFAIGDVSACLSKDEPKGLPMLAQPAIQQGKHLAKNIDNMVNGKAMIPFEYKDKGVMATVGRNKAVADLKRIKLQGFFAFFIWMFIHLMSLAGGRNKLVTFVDWAYNYINYDQPLGAIIRRYKSVK